MNVDPRIRDTEGTLKAILRALANNLRAADNFAPDGTAGHVLTSNGPHRPPSFQAVGTVVDSGATGAQMFLPWSAFNIGDNVHTEFNVSDSWLKDTTGTSQYYCPILLPPGTTITRIRVFVNPSGTTVNSWLNIVSTSDGVSSLVSGPFTATGSSYVTADSGIINVTLAAAWYHLKVQLDGSNALLYGAVIDYE